MSVEIEVIVTTFQKELTIGACLRRLSDHLSVLDEEFRIIVADDASTDRTVLEVNALADPRILVLRSVLNAGKGAQIKAALKHSEAPVVAIFDGDLDIHPQSLVAAIRTLRITGSDAVTGSKSHHESVIHYPLVRRVLSRGFRVLASVMFGLAVRDTQTGMKVFRGVMFRRIATQVHESGFVFDLELLARMAEEGAKITEVPVAIDFDFSSTVSGRAVLQVLRDLISVYRRLT